MNGWIYSREQAPEPADAPILIYCPSDTGYKQHDGTLKRGIFRRESDNLQFNTWVYWRPANITSEKVLFNVGTIVIDKDDEMFAVQHEREEIAKLVSGLFECGYNVPLERQGDREKHNDSLRRLKSRLGIE